MSPADLLAVVDLGSNSFRLEVARLEENRLLSLLYRKETVRLAGGFAPDGTLTPEMQDRALSALARFRECLSGVAPENVLAVGTHAMRRASQNAAFLRAAERALGVPIEIISGEREASFAFSGAVRSLPYSAEERLVVDIGGGSTEITLIRRGVKESAYSYNIGTLRMLHRSEDVNDAELERISADMKAFGGECGHPVNIIGSGGNINKLYKLAQLAGLQDGRDGRLAVPALKEMLGRLKGMDVKERMARFELKPDRADVIVPAGEIFLDVADALRSEYVLVPSLGLADGIVERLYMEFNSWK